MHQIEMPVFLSGKRLTACFTGPRPKNLHGYGSKEPYKPIVDFTESICRQVADAGVARFISGGAQGFDQLAFWAVDRMRKDRPEIENAVYVPFPKQPSRWMETELFGQRQYRLMLRLATECRVLADDPVETYESVRLLHARNHAMVADSDFVIALLADRSLDWRNSKGGTAECVRHARKCNKPVLAIEYRPKNRPGDTFHVNWILD